MISAPHRRVVLIIGGFALAVAVFTWVGARRGIDASVSGPPPQRTATAGAVEEPIIFTGNGSQTTETFYLAGGRYRGDWSAWGEAPEFPPCTHSIELLAVDPNNGQTALGHVADLANLVHVPATGGSSTSYIENVRPGGYYFDVNSACGWQVALTAA
jgi:hypothetical protein